MTDPNAPDAHDDPAFVTLWEHVLENWDDDRAHVAFLEHCRHTEQLLPAAVRYRKMNEEPGKSEQAECGQCANPGTASRADSLFSSHLAAMRKNRSSSHQGHLLFPTLDLVAARREAPFDGFSIVGLGGPDPMWRSDGA